MYQDLVDIFYSSGLMHMGGDEVIVGNDESWAACYNSSILGAPIIELLDELGLNRNDPKSFYFLWENFTVTATKMVKDSYASLQAQGIPATLNKLHIWGGGGADDSGVCYNLMNRPDLTTILPPVYMLYNLMNIIY